MLLDSAPQDYVILEMLERFRIRFVKERCRRVQGRAPKGAVALAAATR
jgi:hypothetical protein